MSDGAPAEPQRPRLNLKPRDPNAAKQLEIQRQASGKNPFGDAKPREAVLASRTGKSETEILAEEVKSEKPKLRLNAQQLEEKRAAEAAVDEIKELIEAATSESSKEQLHEELSARQTSLDELMAGFEKLALEAAKSGEFVRPSERRRQLLESQGSGNIPGLMAGGGTGDPHRDAAGGYDPRGGTDNYRGGGRGGYGGGAGYRETGGYRDGRPGGGFERRGGYGGGRGGGGFDRGGSRGFNDYQEQEGGGGGGGGGYQDRGYGRDGGERRSYEARDYRGPSDHDNVETFGVGAAGFGRDRRGGGGGGGGAGGGGGGGRGRYDRGFGGGFSSYGSGSFEKAGGFEREGDFVQDRY